MKLGWGVQSAVVAVSAGEQLGRCHGAVLVNAVDAVIEIHGYVEKESDS
jgi:hypothetical protein